MKKQLLTLSLFVMSITMFSQSTVWQPYSIQTDTAWGVRYLSVVDTNIVWAATYDRHQTARTSIRFTRTVDGSTFVAGTFLADTFSHSIGNIKAVNDTVAMISLYSKDATRPGQLIGTIDGGVTWNLISDTLTMFTGSANFPDFVHFYDNNNGFAVGDPNNPGTEYEIYRTANGGANWLRVPAANVPNPTSGEYALTSVYTTWGANCIWFGTNKGRAYRSNDAGLTWAVSSVSGMLGGVQGLAFRDSLNGMVWGSSSTTSNVYLLKRTSDGGITWTTVPANTTDIGIFDISQVPGRNAYMSVGLNVGQTAYVTSTTNDDGNTWAVLESGIQEAQRMVKVQMLDSAHGWAGNFSDNQLPLGMNGANKWMGATIAMSCPLYVSGIAAMCSGSVATLTASGSNATYSWSPGGATTNTVSVSPGTTTIYTVNSTMTGCSNSLSYTLTVTPTPTAVVTSGSAIDTIYNANCGTTPTSATLTASGGTTYQWLPGTGLSSTTATVTIATPAASTTYTLTALNGTCTNSTTVSIVSINCAGINQLTVYGTQVSFYPNPSNGLVSVSMSNVMVGTVITISDIVGNEVYKTSVNTNSLNQNLNIDLSSLSKGVYLFGVSNGNQVRVQKLIIQ